MAEAYRILVTARSFGTADERAERLLKEADCEIIKLSGDSESLRTQLEKELPDADAVIAGLETYDEALLEKAGTRCKVISRYGVGYDKVDVETAKKRGMKVTITPGANGDSVADLACALMMDCARNVSVMNGSIKARAQTRPQGLELWEKTLGIVGAGRIGKGVAYRMRGFRMRILVYDTFRDETFAKETDAQYVDWETLLGESDVITVHSPLTPETKGMFGEKEFRKMKNDAILINTARGGIIDEEALYHALKNGELRAAALDATVTEPPYDSPLMELDNCILTPHAGGATREAISKMSYMAAENALSVLQNGTCANEV